MSENVKIRRALLSVSDKTGIVELARKLKDGGVEIISTGGTKKKLEEANIAVTPIEEITHNPEAFGGRMKTISFQVGSALLFRRDNEEDLRESRELGISPIDLVVCNLYPFEKVLSEGSDWDVLVENIDIGGPTMIRAAAKNHKDVTVMCSPEQYETFLQEFEGTSGEVGFETRRRMALEAFRHTWKYDQMISRALSMENEVSWKRPLRYGENSHQTAWLEVDENKKGLGQANQLQGKEMSYNNFLDASAACACCSDLAPMGEEAVVVVKHLNPCGAAVGTTQHDVLENAWNGDSVSAFGSILAFSREITGKTAEILVERFVEVVIAPSFSAEALELFGRKKNVRLIEFDPSLTRNEVYEERSITGGVLVQTTDAGLDTDYRFVVENQNRPERSLLDFGTMAGKHLRSNAIALVSETSEGFALVGAGMGNPNRLVSLEQAIEKARENGHESMENFLLVSDAFFPFRDTVDHAAKFGVRHIVQPGGSIRDEEVMTAAREHGMNLIFSGRRHFKH